MNWPLLCLLSGFQHLCRTSPESASRSRIFTSFWLYFLVLCITHKIPRLAAAMLVGVSNDSLHIVHSAGFFCYRYWRHRNSGGPLLQSMTREPNIDRKHVAFNRPISWAGLQAECYILPTVTFTCRGSKLCFKVAQFWQWNTKLTWRYFHSYKSNFLCKNK